MQKKYIKEMHETAPSAEKAILVALITDKQDVEKTEVYLDELAFLAKTLNIEVVKSFTQRLPRAETRTFLGKGKLQEVVDYAKAHDIDVVIFDDDLTPSQVRNLEMAFNGETTEEAKCKIVDRSLLILDIFAIRAQTAQAHLQVELAQYQYLYPRLTNMWSHLSKQKGGIGMRGPGEKELETDRRIIKDKIALLKEKLEKMESQAQTRRKTREQTVRVALVGYTNVGKSTLMRYLSKSEDILAENKLFATVDSTVRKVVLGGIPFLLTDTVGFIRKLPTLLIESFKSTLNEIVEADILLHVADASTPYCEEQIQIVRKTLEEIGAKDKVTFLLLNKIDLLPEGEKHLPVATKENEEVISISVEKRENTDLLREKLGEIVAENYYRIYPNYQNAMNSWENFVTNEETNDEL